MAKILRGYQSGLKLRPINYGDLKNFNIAAGSISPKPTEKLQEPLTLRQTLDELLRQEVKIDLWTGDNSGDNPIDLEGGDILELDAHEALHPKTGVVQGVAAVFAWLNMPGQGQWIDNGLVYHWHSIW